MKRRSLLLGLGVVLASPAIVRAESLMRVASLRRSVIAPSMYAGHIIGIALNSAAPGEPVQVMLTSDFGLGSILVSNYQQRVYVGQVLDSTGLAIRGDLEWP